ncbi:hypothetical protein GCM10018781_21190 [Kitasatospora indigofera]|uniref:Uncharacterized protein n=1 Tax=Kitasatospora indigofera TaxID=67307 RepID=A0A919FK37_9ACTN|nr:hypothetical protein GCM10018781_21190 [Kitasatospora indigofera]
MPGGESLLTVRRSDGTVRVKFVPISPGHDKAPAAPTEGVATIDRGDSRPDRSYAEKLYRTS